MLDKKQVVSQLKQTASLLELLDEDPFRAKAFFNASQQLDNFKGNFLILYEKKQLEQIKGIGKSLATEVYSLGNKNQLPLLEELMGQIPQGVLELFSVSGLGAKKIRNLWQNDVDSLEKLVQAGKEGTLANLKGFGKKSSESISKAAQFALESQGWFRLDEATVVAEQLIGRLRRKFRKIKIEIAGSLRRGCEAINSIDIVLTNVGFAQVEDLVKGLAKVETGKATLKISLS